MSILSVLKNDAQYPKTLSAKSCDNVFDMDRYLRYLGKRIVQLREDFGWSQPDLAQEMAKFGVNMTQGGVGHIETGSRKPSLPALIALSMALQVSTDYLLGVSDDPTQPEARTVSDAQIELERLFGRLSLQRQHELIVIAGALAEDDELPPMNDVERAVMAAIQFVEEVDGEKYRQLMDLLDSTSPALGRHMTFRRKHIADE